jgi:hypothetical protein
MKEISINMFSNPEYLNLAVKSLENEVEGV